MNSDVLRPSNENHVSTDVGKETKMKIMFVSISLSTYLWITYNTSVPQDAFQTHPQLTCRSAMNPNCMLSFLQSVFHPDGLGGNFPPNNFKFPQNSADNNVVFRGKWRYQSSAKFEIPQSLDESPQIQGVWMNLSIVP